MHRFGFLFVWGTLGFSQTITIQPPIGLPTQGGPVAVIHADFNGDGMEDLAVSDTGSQVISISLGNGDGTFQAAATYPVPSGCVVGYLAAADFNNDHKIDLLGVCQFTSQVLVYLGHGDGTFSAPVSSKLPVPAFAGTIFLEAVSAGIAATVADFDGDGKQDLAILLTSDLAVSFPSSVNIYFLPGNGDGSFGAAMEVERGVAAVALTSADFNGDGKPDIAYLSLTTNGDGVTQSLNILLGDGDGSFHSVASYVWTGASFNIAAQDVNGDGLVDLVAAGISLTQANGAIPPSNVTVLLGDGKGNFKQSFRATDPSGALGANFCLANFSGSGHLDLLEVFSNIAESVLSVDLSVGVRAGNGDGTFQTLQTFAGPGTTYPFSSVCTDLNGDGLADLAYTAISFPLIAGLLAESGGLQGQAGALALLPGGELYLSLNGTPQKLTFSNVNGASFAKSALAQNSIATAFWNSPEKPAGIGVTVTDAAGSSRPAQIFFVSSKQINYGIPDGTVTGNATISITGTEDSITAQQAIAAVAPGVFNAGGLAVGSTLTVHDGKQTPGNLVEPDASGVLQPVPIDVGTGSDQVFLILYGTGIRNHSQPVTAMIATTPAPVAFAAAQGTFVDEDQINVLVPQSLRGAGRVNLVLTVDGQTANPVAIQIQ